MARVNSERGLARLSVLQFVQAMDLSRSAHVAGDLFAQGIERFELVLIPDTLDEVDLDMPTVHLVGKIEQMHLE